MSVFNSVTQEEVSRLEKEIDDAIQNTLVARKKAYDLYNLGKDMMRRADAFDDLGDSITLGKLKLLYTAATGKPAFSYHM